MHSKFTVLEMQQERAEQNSAVTTSIFAATYNMRLKELLRNGPVDLEFLAPKLSSFTGGQGGTVSDDDDGEDDYGRNGYRMNNSTLQLAPSTSNMLFSQVARNKEFAPSNKINYKNNSNSNISSNSQSENNNTNNVSAVSPSDLITSISRISREISPIAFRKHGAQRILPNHNRKGDADDASSAQDDADTDTTTSDALRQAIALDKSTKSQFLLPIPTSNIFKRLPQQLPASRTIKNENITTDSTWDRLSALPKHVQDRVKPAWRHRAGIRELKEGEDISALRPSDRLRVLRNDPALRRDFRRRVAQDDKDRKALFNSKMMERLERQRESDISVACSAVARQTDKLSHDEEEGRGPGFSVLSMSKGGGKQAAPSGRVIRQYFEYATREMQIWRRAQRLSTVEERGKQLQHSRDLRFEEELMQTEKALETRAGETELEIRQNFFVTAVVQAMIMIEWHGKVLDVLNPKSKSVRSVAVRSMLSSFRQQREVKDRYPQWSRAASIPMNACMYQRTAIRKRTAARTLLRAWLQHRDHYFLVKRTRSARIIRTFMRDMGTVLSFTVACRRFKKIVRFVQHHWRGRACQREARKDLLILQLRKQCALEIDQAEKDIERFTFIIKQQEKEVAGKRGLQRLTGAESAHRVIHDMTLRVHESTDYAERLRSFREGEIEDVAWKYVLRLVAEYDHKLVRYVHAFQRYRAQAGIPHGTYQFMTEVQSEQQHQQQQHQKQSSNADSPSSPSLSTPVNGGGGGGGVIKPTRPFFRRLLPQEDVQHILKMHCGDASANNSNLKKDGSVASPHSLTGSPSFITSQSVVF